MQFIIKCILFTLLALIGNANAQKSLSGLSGQDIVKVLAEFDELCPEKTPAGERWAPLASGKPCGSVPRCNFPHEWCAFKAKEGKKEVDWSSLKCQPLKPDCTNAILRKVGSLPPTTPTTVPTTTPLPTTTPPPTTPKPTTPEPTTPKPTTPPPTTPKPTTTPPPTTPPPTTAPPTTAPPTTAPPTTPPMSTTPPTTTPPASPTPPITPPPFTPPSVPGGGVMPPSGGALGCCDFHEYCCFWASKGFCESNRDFMVPICMQSCGTCGCTGDIKSCLVQVAPPCTLQNVMSGTACPCKPTDLVNKDWGGVEMCQKYSMKGQCDRNPKYMRAMCKQSCNVCSLSPE